MNSQYFLLTVPELTTISKMRKCPRENSERKLTRCRSLLTLCLLHIRRASEVLHTRHLLLPGLGSSAVSEPLPRPLLCLAFPLSSDTRNPFGLCQPGRLRPVRLLRGSHGWRNHQDPGRPPRRQRCVLARDARVQPASDASPPPFFLSVEAPAAVGLRRPGSSRRL